MNISIYRDPYVLACSCIFRLLFSVWSNPCLYPVVSCHLAPQSCEFHATFLEDMCSYTYSDLCLGVLAILMSQYVALYISTCDHASSMWHTSIANCMQSTCGHISSEALVLRCPPYILECSLTSILPRLEVIYIHHYTLHHAASKWGYLEMGGPNVTTCFKLKSWSNDSNDFTRTEGYWTRSAD